MEWGLELAEYNDYFLLNDASNNIMYEAINTSMSITAERIRRVTHSSTRHTSAVSSGSVHLPTGSNCTT